MIMKNICNFCNWTNALSNLNIGEPNKEQVWICHGCVKRQWQQLTQLANASACVLAHRDEITKHSAQAGSALSLLLHAVNKANELLGGKERIK